MTKIPSLIFVALWAIILPIVVIGIGFAGNRLWLPSAIYAEAMSGRLEGLLIRAGLLIYLLSPIIVFRSYRRQAR